jgi:hypothetical protein
MKFVPHTLAEVHLLYQKVFTQISSNNRLQGDRTCKYFIYQDSLATWSTLINFMIIAFFMKIAIAVLIHEAFHTYSIICAMQSRHS